MRAKLLKGFSQLLSKSVVASAIGFLVLLLVIQIIGVDEYGKYAGAFSVILFLELLLKFEVKLVLVKAEAKKEQGLFSTAFSLLLGISLLAVAVLWGLLSVVPDSLNPYSEFTEALLLLAFVLPVSVLTEIPRAILERNMRFKLISNQELGSALIQHGTSLLLVFFLESYVALVVSWYVYNITILLLSMSAIGYTPRFGLDRKEVEGLFHHSRHIFFQNLMSHGKKLANPLIVGYFLGSSGVGIVSFAEKIVQGLSFYKNALQRVTVSTIGSLGEDKEKLMKYMKEGTLLQMLPLAFLLLGGSVIVYLISIWAAQDLWIWMNKLYPFLAVGFFFYILLTIPKTMLQMHGGLKYVTHFWLVFDLIFFVSAFFGVKYFGVIGYGIAEIMTMPAYFILFRSVRKTTGEILTNDIIILMICVPILLMWYYIGYLSLFALPAVLLIPKLTRTYKKIWKEIW